MFRLYDFTPTAQVVAKRNAEMQWSASQPTLSTAGRVKSEVNTTALQANTWIIIALYHTHVAESKYQDTEMRIPTSSNANYSMQACVCFAHVE